jgi:hypothetical protein
VRTQELMIVGAEYDINTGLVDFFDIPVPVKKPSFARKRKKA